MIDLLFRDSLIYQRGDGFIGTMIRCFTSSFVHWDNNHLLWNMIALVLIGLILIDYDETIFWHGVLFAPFIIGLTVHFFCTEITSYCGFSGVVFTLLTLSFGCLIQSNKKSLKTYGWITIIATFLKVTWELVTGTPLFAEASTFHVLPAAHLAGIWVGLIILCFHRYKILQWREWRKFYLLLFGV